MTLGTCKGAWRCAACNYHFLGLIHDDEKKTERFCALCGKSMVMLCNERITIKEVLTYVAAERRAEGTCFLFTNLWGKKVHKQNLQDDLNQDNKDVHIANWRKSTVKLVRDILKL